MTLNRKNKIRIVIIAIAVLLISIFLLLYYRQSNHKDTTPSMHRLSDLMPADMLAKMTLEEKVGQMLVVGFWGTEPDYYINKMINERNIGGIIMMKYNIKDREQTKMLIEDLQKQSLDTDPAIPLFIAVDQEGGVVSRVSIEGVNELTAQKNITSAAQAYDVAKKRATELKELGINVNFSPVVDVITNKNSFLYDRVFRSDNINGVESNTLEFSHAMMRGYEEGGIIAVPKHFPGYTNEVDDPHEKMPISMLLERDLVYNQQNGSKNYDFLLRPFKNLIDQKEGIPKIIMVTPIIYKNIDPNNPVVFSSYFINQLLRKILFYNGLVITDDMEMGALSSYTVSDAAVKAVQAGNDILLYTSTPEKQAEAYNAIIKAVRDGQISEEQINRSVLKILELKKQKLPNK